MTKSSLLKSSSLALPGLSEPSDQTAPAPPSPPAVPRRRTPARTDVPFDRHGNMTRASLSAPLRLPRMLSPADVAALLQVSTKTVRRWIEAGELRVYTLGRQLRVSEDDLSAFVKSKRK